METLSAIEIYMYIKFIIIIMIIMKLTKAITGIASLSSDRVRNVHRKE